MIPNAVNLRPRRHAPCSVGSPTPPLQDTEMDSEMLIRGDVCTINQSILFYWRIYKYSPADTAATGVAAVSAGVVHHSEMLIRGDVCAPTSVNAFSVLRWHGLHVQALSTVTEATTIFRLLCA